MSVMHFLGKILKTLRDKWDLARTRSALGLLDDEALKDVGLTRAQVWENPRLANWLRNDPYRHHKAS
ncbi:MAG: Uncharacterized conserved protein YjiS, DUF1127 family [Glomeribacter sp. 1016415]|uniref:Uncharacterized conserved small protein n=1 Tax=Mycoavidus cysteinexigens TaxID=1553431 RepID=A0A2Z6EV82_9BURK|nr:DUF1127 domain-containing protein [Mycoavidus cysteinexigens]MCX8567089.1 Uncharacterized conserved protein YjiS, DUF1127 family [Glomeribacter sp. 1016415]BBE09357.1 Uncharacterized conserved small protein [Mycoavidus cysteinexigens]GAM51884.1 hypothetical protein EBME_0347 [bacterium endosymbiont of Mortierella elongata FMR23-6]GLR01943.1 hypothetical protein GCM10007934_17560 [Mycoavidus cysteinexigens]